MPLDIQKACDVAAQQASDVPLLASAAAITFSLYAAASIASTALSIWHRAREQQGGKTGVAARPRRLASAQSFSVSLGLSR
jgi:hypothetical protein